MKKHLSRKIVALSLVLTFVTSLVPVVNLTAFAADVSPMLTVDMLDDLGPIIHGSSGFLYGISSEDVPTASLITPLKPKVIATKGAVGTEHPYGDSLDIAKTFLESGGEMVQMYNSNYYAIFQPTQYYQDYVEELRNVICPAVVEWKAKWKEEHNADPVTGIDDLGLNIDKAIVYLPINEGDSSRSKVSGEDIRHAFEAYYKVIKEVDPKATVGGPNDALYGHWRGYGMRGFLQYCHENDCWPDVITWHQLDTSNSRFAEYPREFADYELLCKEFGRSSQVVINEYAGMTDCGVPGRLVNWISRFEDAGVWACLPFWHQANNLNDLAADANEPNAAWWLYKWYGDMSGNRRSITTRNTELNGLYGLSTVDDNKKVSTTLFGGVDGGSAVVLKDIDKTETFKNAAKVHVKIDATYFKGFRGMTEPATIIEGTFPVENGNLIIELKDMKYSTAYKLTVTPAKDGEEVGNPLISEHHGIYEAEDAAKVGNASDVTDGKYYLSGGRAVAGFGDNVGIDYTISLPLDGKYKIELVYGNEIGLNRGDETLHKPVNALQKLSIDGGNPADMILINTMERAWTGIHTEYIDLTAGTHKISIRGTGNRTTSILQDALHVTYAGVYGLDIPAFDMVYEAESADFNELAATKKTAVTNKTDLSGYTGSGYVTGLNVNPVTSGGGIRWNVVVEESGLYNFSLRYQSAASGTANIYIGNTARTFEGFKKPVSLSNTAGNWDTVRATIYLQKGVNIVDVDANADIALDSLRVKKAQNASDLSREVNAVSAIPAGAQMTGVEYKVWSARWNEELPYDEMFQYLELYSTVKTVNKTVSTTLSPDGNNFEYVVGRSLTGDKDAGNDKDKYLEFEVEVPSAGTYAMQVFHSGDEIFGTHGYNTKIIDKFACIKVNNQEPKRYFFINSISRDTFKEKSIYLDLQAGKNTIKVFNDDSWSVLKGLDDTYSRNAGLPSSGTGSSYVSFYRDKPGNIPIVNSLPNLSKFIITPAALSVPLADTVVEHAVNIRTTSGGTAVADKNTVVDGGSVTFTISAQTALSDVLVNGVSKKNELTDAEQGVYKLKVADVKEDLEVLVYFVREAETENDLDSLIANNSFGTGDTAGWTLITSGQSAVETDIFNRYNSKNYLRLSGSSNYVATLGQSITVSEGGVYNLGFSMKNLNDSSAEIGDYNSIEFTAMVGGKTYIYKAVAPSEEYEVIEGLLTIPEGGATVEFSVKIDARAGFDAYLDAFTIKKADISIIPGTGVQKLTGTIFGLVQDSWEISSPPVNAFDGNTNTYYDGQSGSYAGIHLGLPYYLKQIRFVPRSTFAGRMTGNVFQGSNDGGLTWDTLHTITGTPSNNPTYTTVDLTPTKAYSSYRIYSGSSSYCNVSVVEFRGEMADASGTLQKLLNEAKEAASLIGWTVWGRAILDKSIAFAQSVIDSGTDDIIIMINATEPLRYALSLAPTDPDRPLDPNLAYFVDCGSHDPSLLYEGDLFGVYNSVTEQHFGLDQETGMNWGLVLQSFDSLISNIPVSGSKGVFTNYTWAFEQSGGNTPGIPKNQSCRYAKNQTESGISPRSIAYRFELPEGKYTVQVALRNTWNNASPVTVLLNGVSGGSTTVPSSDAQNATVAFNTNDIIISADEGSATGTLDLLLQSTAPTIQVAYITIAFADPVDPRTVTVTSELTAALVTGYKANIPVNVDLAGFEGDQNVNVKLIDDSGKIWGQAVTKDDKAVINVAESLIAGKYTIVASVDGVEGSANIQVADEPGDLWAVTFGESDGNLLLKFGAKISENGVSVKIDGIPKNILTVKDNYIIVSGVSSDVKGEIVIQGVKFTELFPSYKFKFTVTK